MEIRSPDVAPPRGLLNERVSMAHFDLIRIAPSEPLKPFVENHWIILWDLTGKPAYTQQNLPHPSPNMVIVAGGQSGVFGVQTGIWIYRLKGAGRIFGTKFWPGTVHAFLQKPVSTLTDRFISIAEIFAVRDDELERRLLERNDPADMRRDIEALLLSAGPVSDAGAIETRRMIELAASMPEITQPGQLAKAAGVSLRTMQRLFETYAGINPKWVIDRYRMLAAVDVLNSGQEVNLTTLAHDLGYFDQAHFTNAFRSLTGKPPSRYRSLPPASS